MVRAGKEVNKRTYPRRRKPYGVSVVLSGKPHKAIGVDISAGGVGLLTEKPIGREEFELHLRVDDVDIEVRVRVVRERPILHHGGRAFSYGLQFSGISADDWDAIVRYTTDKPVAEPTNQVVGDLEIVRMMPDDTARLLPQALQTKLLAMLVRRGRLAPLDDKVTPLVQYFYGGIVRYEGKLMHRLTIQSKIVDRRGLAAARNPSSLTTPAKTSASWNPARWYRPKDPSAANASEAR